MDKIAKALQSFSIKERELLKKIIKKIKNSSFENLDLKKLKNRQDIFRVRQGKIRIIFQKRGGKYYILAVERRSDNTYNKY